MRLILAKTALEVFLILKIVNYELWELKQMDFGEIKTLWITQNSIFG